MIQTIGEDWLEFFDLCVCDAVKPLFYRNEIPFENSEEKKFGTPLSLMNVLKKDAYAKAEDKLLLKGNVKLLTNYFKESMDKSDLKLVFFSSHLY